MDRGVWQATQSVGSLESDMTEHLDHHPQDLIEA